MNAPSEHARSPYRIPYPCPRSEAGSAVTGDLDVQPHTPPPHAIVTNTRINTSDSQVTESKTESSVPAFASPTHTASFLADERLSGRTGENDIVSGRP